MNTGGTPAKAEPFFVLAQTALLVFAVAAVGGAAVGWLWMRSAALCRREG